MWKSLFGTSTLKRDGSLAGNGFNALADFDQENGSPNGRIDRRDPIYPRLRLWIDANHNGMSERQELRTLRNGGVLEIFTDFTERRRRDEHGNWYRLRGSATVLRNGHERPRRVFDVYFKMLPP